MLDEILQVFGLEHAKFDDATKHVFDFLVFIYDDNGAVTVQAQNKIAKSKSFRNQNHQK